jgi:hypothetical protein
MAAKSSIINIAVLGDAKNLKKSLGGAAKSVEGFTSGSLKKLGSLAKGFTTLSVTAGGALLGLGTSLQGIEASIIKGTGASGDALEGMKDSALEIAKVVPNSLAEVGAAVADTSTFFGVQGEELENLATLFLNFGRVTGTEVGDSMKNVRGLMSQFGIGVDEIDGLLGTFLVSAQGSGSSMGVLLSQMETFGPLFANAGFSVAQTADIFSQLESSGVSITRVGPGLNKFFRDVAAGGGDGKEALSDVVGLIFDAETAADALNIATDSFGAEGAQRMVSSIRSGNFELESFNGMLGDGAGVVGTQAKAIEGLSDKLSIFKNRLLIKIAPIAERVFDSVVGFVDRMGPALDSVTAAIEEQGLMGALAHFLEEGWDWLKAEGFPLLGEKMAGAASFLWDWIGENVPDAIHALSRGISELWLYLTNTGLPWLGIQLEKGTEILSDWISNALPDSLAELGIWMGELIHWLNYDEDGLPALAEWGVAAATTIAEQIPAMMEGVVKGVGEWFKGLFTGALDDEETRKGFMSYGEDMWDAITEGMARGMLEAGWGDTIKGIGGWLNPFDGNVFGPPAEDPAIRGAGAGASGAIVTRPTMSLIGEAGPEMLIPLNKMPGASPLPSMMGMGGGMVININMPTGANGADVIDAIKRETRNRGATAFPVTAGRRR